MNTPKLQISTRISLERERTMPVAGELLVREGDEVREGDVVLRAKIKSEIVTLKIREMLNLSEEEISSCFMVSHGEHVLVGQVLFKRAGLFGFFSEEVRSPIEGEVELIDEVSGFIGIRPPSKNFELKAYLRGRVVGVEEGKTVKIASSSSSIIQGVFGFGGEAMGVLKVVSSFHEITSSCENLIVAFPGHLNPQQILSLAMYKLKGIVVSTISSSFLMLSDVEKGRLSGLTLVVVDGFGNIPVSGRLTSFLNLANSKECSISGQVQIRAGAIRPELIVHEALTAVSSSIQDDLGELKIGSEVRIVRGEDMGRLGKCLSFSKAQTEFPSGIKCLSVMVDLGESKKEYPLQNIEAI